MGVQLSSAHMAAHHLVVQKPGSMHVQMESMANMSESAMPQTNRTIYNCVKYRFNGEVGTTTTRI